MSDGDIDNSEFRFTVHYDEAVLRSAVNRFMKRRLLSGFGVSGLLAVAVTIAALVFLLWQGDRSWVVGAIGAVLVVFAAIIAALWRWRHAEMQSKLAMIPSKQAVVTLSNAGISVETEAGATTLPWTGFCELWKLEHCWLLFLAPNNFVTLPTGDVAGDALDYLESQLPRACKIM